MRNPYLVIIDVQEKLMPHIHNKENLLSNIEILIRGFKIFDLPIIVTEQVPDKLGSTVKSIKSLLDDVDPVSKSSFSCAGETEFLKRSESLSQNDGIILAGIETHICVYQTERDLISRGHHVEVVTNAVGSRDKNNHDIALDRIRNNGGFLTTVEMLLFNLQEKAGGERFKKLAKLIK